MIRDSAGNVNQCTDEIIAATIDKFWELLSETDQYTIIEWMVDTGCGTIVAHSSQADRWLQNSRKSTLVMNGFSTSSSETAEIVGDLPAYVLNIVSPHTPNVDLDDDSSRIANGWSSCHY